MLPERSVSGCASLCRGGRFGQLWILAVFFFEMRWAHVEVVQRVDESEPRRGWKGEAVYSTQTVKCLRVLIFLFAVVLSDPPHPPLSRLPLPHTVPRDQIRDCNGNGNGNVFAGGAAIPSAQQGVFPAGAFPLQK